MDLRRPNFELNNLNRELDTFGFAVSQDLVAPARRILGFCGVLKEDYAYSLNSDGMAVLHRIEKATTNMKDIVSGLLSLSRLTRSELNVTKVNFSDIARDILLEVQASSPDRKVETVIKPDIVVLADATLMRILLENLIDNAWKYTGKKEY